MIFDKLRTKKATILGKNIFIGITSEMQRQVTSGPKFPWVSTWDSERLLDHWKNGEVTGKLLRYMHILCMIVYVWWLPLVWSECLVKVVGFCRNIIRYYIVIRWFFPLPRSSHEHPWSTHQHASPRKDGCLGVVIHKLFQGVGREILLVLGEECHLAKTGDDHGWMRWEWIFVRVLVEHKKKDD